MPPTGAGGERSTHSWCHPSWLISLARDGAAVDGVEDGLAVGWDHRREGLDAAVDGDGRRSQGSELAADLAGS